MTGFRCATMCVLATLSLSTAKGEDQPTVRQPVNNQVVQRDENGRGVIPIKLAGVSKDEINSADVYELSNGNWQLIPDVKYVNGALVGVPTGGPYDVRFTLRNQPVKEPGEPAAPEPVEVRDYPIPVSSHRVFSVMPVYVGDLWILAGQSNMEGVGDLVDVEPRSSMVQALGMDGKWAIAEEPLHWLLDSPDPVHSGNPDDRAARADAVRRTRTKGAGMGLPFGAAMVEATGVPVGLVCCAHGGTSMAQWDPAKKGEGGNSLYGSMLRQTELAGGKFKGLLWYQGESDAIAGAADVYPKVFADFIAAVRQDLNQPDLPFYLVQIGRFANPSDPRGWNQIQNAQRLIPDQIANTAVISVIDLPMDDAIHVGTQGLKRAGNRMANVVQHELFRKILGTTPTFDRVSRGPNNTLVVRFKGVNVLSGEEPTGLLPRQRIAGFSIRDAEGKEIPMIFEARGGTSLDTVILNLSDVPPPGSSLWYGWGLNPYCNLVDSVDMAVPVFGPIGLDDVK